MRITVPLYGFGGSDGGTSLNVKVVGGTSVPANPKENTIWVKTDVYITGYYFQAKQPEGMQQGEIWISTGMESQVAFNAIKKGSVMVYPLSAKQYISGALVDVTAKSYQGGEWVEWIPAGALYWLGNELTSKTGGWVNTHPVTQFTKHDTYMEVTGVIGTAPGNISHNTPITPTGTTLIVEYSLSFITANDCVIFSTDSKGQNVIVRGSITAVGDNQQVVVSMDGAQNTSGYITLSASGGVPFKIHKIWFA